MIATKIGFFTFRVHFGPLKVRYSQLYFILFYSKLKDLNVLYYRYSSNVDIYSSKRLWKLSVMKIGLGVSRPILSP